LVFDFREGQFGGNCRVESQNRQKTDPEYDPVGMDAVAGDDDYDGDRVDDDEREARELEPVDRLVV